MITNDAVSIALFVSRLATLIGAAGILLDRIDVFLAALLVIAACVVILLSFKCPRCGENLKPSSILLPRSLAEFFWPRLGQDWCTCRIE